VSTEKEIFTEEANFLVEIIEKQKQLDQSREDIRDVLFFDIAVNMRVARRLLGILVEKEE